MDSFIFKRKTKRACILHHSCKFVLNKNTPVQNTKSKLCTWPFKIKVHSKNWLINLRAHFVVTLNESAHKKVGHIELGPVLAPAHMHHCNAAERAVNNSRNNFIVRFSTTDPDFLVSEWDQLLPQATITINWMRNARVNPQLLAYDYVFGTYYFNKNPKSTPWKRVAIHENTIQWTPWVHCGTPGLYVGPARDNYKINKWYMRVTGAIRTIIHCNTLQISLPYQSLPLKITSSRKWGK